MHFFAQHQLQREQYKNSFDFINYIEDLEKYEDLTIQQMEQELNKVRSLYNSNYYYSSKHEYVVIWYRQQIVTHNNADDSLVYIDVLLANLTKPTYPFGEKKIESDSYITAQIPISYLHKMPIGSIWKNGKSKERFKLDTYELKIDKDIYHIHSIFTALTTQKMKENGKWNKETKKYEPYDGDVYPDPFKFKKYFDKISKEDRNQLINIEYEGQQYVIHPFLLLITHYGYSMDIKRIISRYPVNEIEKRLIPTDDRIDAIARDKGLDEYIILPQGFTQRDAVFLYHYKYNQSVRTLVERMHNKIQQNKTNEKEVIRVDFWNTPLELKIRGICFDDVILCTSIIGISEPQIKKINVFLRPKKNVDFTSDKDRAFSVVTPYTPPQNIEELDYVRNPVNSIIYSILSERLEQLGNLTELNVVRPDISINPIGENTKFLQYSEIQEVSVGDKQGAIGNTGYANCFFDVDENNYHKGRFDKVWEHAKIYAKEIGGKAEWFTYERGFNSNDDFYLMSLSKFHPVAYDIQYPKNVLVIRISTANSIYFIIEFGEDIEGKKLKGYNALAYQPIDNENFLASPDGLPALLMKVVTLNGTINSDFVDSYNGNIAYFKHRDGINNNWVRNGIKKLKD